MKAVRAANGSVEVVDVPEPAGDGVRVRVVSAGICGTDLHLVGDGLVEGTTLGHEIAGFTADGTAVAVEPVISCGDCAACVGGDNGRCADALPNLIGIGADGGMAESVLVPEQFLVTLSDGLEVRDACLVEPLAVAVRALHRAGVREGVRVVVVGGGSIGLCAVAVARHLGASVELLARHDHQLEAGARLGALEVTDEPAPIVIEAAGTESALATAVEKCAPGGTVGIPGSYWEPVQLPGMLMGVKEVSLVPSIMYGRTTGSRDVDVAAGILAETPTIADVLITHRFPLDGAEEAFAAAGDRSHGAIKVALHPAD